MPNDARKADSTRPGVLTIPFQPFYSDPLPIGTEVEIISEEESTYTVKFPGKVGFSGSFRIQRPLVKEV